jgi:all-trans-retinol dehydrogenase (NAD+)
MTKLRNSVVLLTDGGNAFGYSLATRFAQRGVKLVLWDRNATRGQQLADELKRLFGITVYSYQVDLNNRDQVYASAAAVKRDVMNIDVLINNADYLMATPINELNVSNIERTIRINTMSVMWTIREFLPVMVESRRGHIVNLTTCIDAYGTAKLVDYCASKAGVKAFHEGLHQEIRRLKMVEKRNIQLTLVTISFPSSVIDPSKKAPMISVSMATDDMAEGIVQAIKSNDSYRTLPAHIPTFTGFLALLPESWANWVRDFTRVSSVSDTFRKV